MLPIRGFTEPLAARSDKSRRRTDPYVPAPDQRGWVDANTEPKVLRMLLPFGLLAVAALALVRRKGDDWEYETAEEDAAVRAVPLGTQTGRRRGPKARLALVAAFTSLFFAGAAFTAGAGDQLAKMLDPKTPLRSRRVSPTLPPRRAEAAPTATVAREASEAARNRT